jgi:hypothetical protein
MDQYGIDISMMYGNTNLLFCGRMQCGHVMIEMVQLIGVVINSMRWATFARTRRYLAGQRLQCVQHHFDVDLRWNFVGLNIFWISLHGISPVSYFFYFFFVILSLPLIKIMLSLHYFFPSRFQIYNISLPIFVSSLLITRTIFVFSLFLLALAAAFFPSKKLWIFRRYLYLFLEQNEKNQLDILSFLYVIYVGECEYTFSLFIFYIFRSACLPFILLRCRVAVRKHRKVNQPKVNAWLSRVLSLYG